MNKGQIIRRSQRITWYLTAFASALVCFLVVGQYVILKTDFGEQWTLVGQLTGRPLAELEPEILLSAAGVEMVYDVRLTAGHANQGILRLYIDEHLVKTLSAGETIHMALEKGQQLCADGGLLTETMTVYIQSEEQMQPQAVQIRSGAWQVLEWEK